MNNNSIYDISITEILKKIYLNLSFVAKISILSLILGLVIIILTQNTYKSSVTFFPHFQDMENQNIRELAGIAGFQMGSKSNEIPTTLYPKLLNSIPFKKELLKTKLLLNEEKIIYGTYLINQKNIFSKIIYSLKYVPKFIINSLRNNKSTNETKKNDKLISISSDEYNIYNILESKISIEVDEFDGYVIISVIDNDPIIAANIAESALSIFQKRIIDYKIKNSKSQYDFINEQLKLKKKEFYILQDSLANFKDNNKNIKSDIFQNKLSRLDAEVKISNSIYNDLSLKREQAAIELNKDTPIFTIINPVYIPFKPISPNISLILLLSIFIGFSISIIWIILKDFIILKYKKIVDKKS